VGGQGGRIASHGTRLPSRRPVPQAAAAPARRWRADGGVNKTALGAAASHHALAGDRQELGGSGRATAQHGRDSSPRGVHAREFAREGWRSQVTDRVLAVTDTAELSDVRSRPGWAGRTVERGGSSDMLPRLNYPGISRGFEFSATCNRRCRPAAEASAIGRSRGRSLGLGRAGRRALEAKLDRVRNGSSPDFEIALGLTPGGGAYGVVPPSIGARERADRYATTRPPLGFRAGESLHAAACSLHRMRGGWPIGSL